MPPPPMRAVSFDAAGTLIHVAEPVAETYCGIAARFGIALEPVALARAFKTLFPRMSPLAFGRCSEADRERQEREWWRTLVRNCLGPKGQHARFNAYFDALYEHYRAARAWRLYPEVIEVLDVLETQGVRRAVVSNFDSRLCDVLRGLGVAHRFDAIVYSAAAGSAKPDPGIFLDACERLQCRTGEVLHVGDTRTADYDGARAAGLAARWLRRGDASASASAGETISDLRELPGVGGRR